MRESMPLIFGWKVDFAKHPNVHVQVLFHLNFIRNKVDNVPAFSPHCHLNVAMLKNSDVAYAF